MGPVLSIFGFARRARPRVALTIGPLSIAWALASALAVLSPAWAAEQQARKGDAEFRQAWVTYAGPAMQGRVPNMLEAAQEARMAAIPQMEAAVQADPRNVDYLTSLAYMRLAAGQYDKAKAAIDAAIQAKRDEPLLYLLRGQDEAALALMHPETAGDRIGTAVRAFDEAGRIDPGNALPLLQGASVAFDANRPDLAQPRLKRALESSDIVLYRLPVPADLFPEVPKSLSAWQYVQVGHWVELLSRCQNVAKACLRAGEREQQAGNLEAAYEQFLSALEVGRKIGTAKPYLFVTVASAMGVLEKAYAALSRVGEALNKPETARWKGEAGVLIIGRDALAGALQNYMKDIAEHPPSSLSGMLSTEAKYVSPVIAGIGLTPQPVREEEPQQVPPS